MRKIFTPANYEPSLGQHNSGISLTVPDQTLTIKEILVKYANGTMSDINIQPQFNEEMDDLRGLDYVELNEIAKQNKEHITELQANLEKYKTDSANKKKQAKDKELKQLREQIDELKKQIK